MRDALLKQIEEWESLVCDPPVWRCRSCKTGHYGGMSQLAVADEGVSRPSGWKCDACGDERDCLVSDHPLTDSIESGELAHVCVVLRNILGKT